MRPLRIALAHPVYWPEVHRGSERIVHDIAREMALRGHDVTLLTTQPRRWSKSRDDGFAVVRSRRPPRPPGLGLYELFLETVPELALRLRFGRFDVAHAFHLSSANGAALAAGAGGPPFVYSFHGMATRTYIVARRRRIEMLERALSRARAVTVLSEAAADEMRRRLFVDPLVLPAGVTPPGGDGAARFERPTLLCAASFNDPRKRVPLLLEAFAELRGHRPDARLLLADNPDPSIAVARPELPAGAEWADLNAPGALGDAYSRSWATVLPAVHEAQGMVLLESLAAGTPFVAAASGAPPEIHGGDDRIGRIFAADAREALVSAMDEILDLAADPGTAAACRRRAGDYSWERLAPAHEELYAAALGRGG